MNINSESSAEIITATPDGSLLIYSDSPLGGIGMIDIRNPKNPLPAGFIKMDGEPTSVAVSAIIFWLLLIVLKTMFTLPVISLLFQRWKKGNCPSRFKGATR